MASHLLRGFALLSVGVLFAAGFAAASEDSDSDGIDDGVEADTARNVLAHGGGESFFIRSRSVGAGTDDVFDLDFTQGEFTVAYVPQDPGPETVSYTLEFRRLQEFYMEGGEPRVVNESDLSSEYAGVTVVNDTTTDGEPRTVFTVGSVSGVFTIRVGITARFADVGGGLVTPMEAKVDLEIRGWPWDPSRTDTRLRLEVDVYTEAVARAEDTTLDESRGWAAPESQVNVTGGSDSVFFSWADSALVDGVERPVQSTPLIAEGEGFSFYLMYERGNAIVHDPKMGVESAAFWSIWYRPPEPSLQADLTLYAVGLAAIAGVVALTVVVRRRRRA